MTETKKNFLYLTELIDIPVLDNSGKKIGRLSDITATVGQSYPKITGFVVRKKGMRLYFPWIAVKQIEENRCQLLFWKFTRANFRD